MGMRTALWLVVGSTLLTLVWGCTGRRTITMTDPDGAVPDGQTGDSMIRPDGAVFDAPTNMSELVDPNCVDGMYTEVLPDFNASLATVDANFSSDPAGYFEAALGVRWSGGADIVRQGRMNTMIGDCVEFFGGSPSSPEEALRRMSLIVHECGHFLDIGLGNFGESAYWINPNLTLRCGGGRATSQGGNTYARSRLNNDSQSAMRPPCNGDRSPTCDSYADVYLDGNPDDGEFDGGDQGYASVLEETVQYVNSLVTGYTFQNEYQGSVSERDGILTFLWYVERYLAYARTEFPNAYQFILNDACWREATLTAWGRAWLYLEATDGLNQLGINDDALMTLVTQPAMLAEIEAIREAHGCM